MKTEWPQITIILIYLSVILIDAHNHGKELRGKTNVFESLFLVASIFAILYYGGFWTN